MVSKIETQVNTHKTVCFRLTCQELKKLHWKEKDQEFEFKGMMYDVLAIALVNDCFLLTAMADGTETSMQNSFYELVNGLLDDLSGNSSSNEYGGLALAEFLLPCFHYHLQQPANVLCVLNFRGVSFLPVISKEVLTPPPKQMFV